MNLNERWDGFWNEPNVKFKILALFLAIAFLYNAVYQAQEYKNFTEQFTFNACYNIKFRNILYNTSNITNKTLLNWSLNG